MDRSPVWKPGLALAVMLVVAACGGGEAPSGGEAGAAVRTFYEHLDAGRYDDAKALYDEATRQQLFPDAGADEGFRQWASMETHEESLAEVIVVSETDSDDGVTVEFQLKFSDGETVQRQVTLTREADAWRLGIIG